MTGDGSGGPTSALALDTSRMRRFEPGEEVDVVIVGTGAGGAPVLAELAAAGLRVVALEAGPFFDPADHTPDETDAAEINWMSERLSGGDDPTAFGPNNSGRGVGGSTLHWGAFTPRPDAGQLRLRTETGEGRDWPFSLEELLPFLVRAERDLGVSGPADYPWDPARSYAYAPAGRNASAQHMADGCRVLGIRATDAPAAVLTRPREQHGIPRGACIACGTCHQGCRTGAKATMGTTYLPAAIAAGAEIRAEAMVHTVETDAAGRVSAVVYRQAGRDLRQPCRALVLAGGGVETPRLLLANDIGNANGQVGRNFLAHPATQVWGTFDAQQRAYRGYPSSLITEDFLRPPGADFAGGYLIQSLGVMPLTFATSLVRGGGLWGAELMAALEGARYTTGLGINGECLPQRDNALVLSGEVDEHGIPRAEVSFTAGENEKALMRHATDVMVRILEAAGATSTRVLDRTAHTLGTCRMSDDPQDGVVDASGRSHEVENLWIVDNSTFPSALAANPALTQVALALRSSQHLLAGH